VTVDKLTNVEEELVYPEELPWRGTVYETVVIKKTYIVKARGIESARLAMSHGNTVSEEVVGELGVIHREPDVDSIVSIKEIEARAMRTRRRYGFVVCPTCGTGHTNKTICCRNCGYKKSVPPATKQ
jgi:hypothetical protein